MSLRADITERQTEAQKSKDELRLSVLRMLWSEIKNIEIDKKKELDDKEIQQIAARQIKQLKDANKDFSSAGRDDLVSKNEAEIKILEEYLPEQMGDEELTKIIESVISETGANEPGDIGKVMGAVMKKAQGQADGNKVRELASHLLSKK
ncbi:MAG: GatB/YqeY domain-containing protein [Candidatus Magasanikbacteria bacterium]|nr:GatB/YqeY domain-containing protein [Candidatus Magasanikbacteria bacterium]MBT4547625.1 GatB/YqeY domain-containing protein [Candidatus Magasanikbacteria bacterium]MBT6818882.1 GatB/YqeY domain-containing protein [Candidatus Magasanikbacteria bacterium]